MANTKDNVAAKETKRRLIDAAGEVFAEHGFERATIKEITSRAGVAMTAINYHFSDKTELYYQVIRHAHESASTAIDDVEHFPASMSPPQRLRVFVGTLLGDMLNPAMPKWRGVLLWREMQQPTAATVRYLSETFCDCSRIFEGLITSLVRQKIPQHQLRLIAESVIGQCLFHVHHAEMHKLMFPDERPAFTRVDELADHITEFSLAAIHGMFQAKPSVKNRKQLL